jgi:hypothetical protein
MAPVIYMIAVPQSLLCLPDTLAVGKNKKIQTSKEMVRTEEKLDARIVDLNNQLLRYNKLLAIDTTLTPQQTHFRKNNEENFIELETYRFTTEGMINPKGDRSEYQISIIRLYFDNDSLSKVSATLIKENFITKEKIVSTVLDPTPLDKNTRDIVITTRFNEDDEYSVPMANIENTFTHPLRNKFKRDFYIEFLSKFEYMFRMTEEYQKRYGTQQDEITIDNLRRTLLP